MGKLPIKLTNERREQVWHLLLKGNNAQQIKKTLNISNATVHRDISFLTTKSKRYIYDIAKGLHLLCYQRAIEGIGLALSESWTKFNDPKVPEKTKVSYLRLVKECNTEMMQLTIKGPLVMAIDDLRKRIERAGINVDSNLPNLDNNNGRRYYNHDDSDDNDNDSDEEDKRDNGNEEDASYNDNRFATSLRSSNDNNI